MAFQFGGLKRIATGATYGAGQDKVVSWYLYATVDPAAIVEAPGYFDAMAGQFAVGDQIDVALGLLGLPARKTYVVLDVSDGVVSIALADFTALVPWIDVPGFSDHLLPAYGPAPATTWRTQNAYRPWSLKRTAARDVFRFEVRPGDQWASDLPSDKERNEMQQRDNKVSLLDEFEINQSIFIETDQEFIGTEALIFLQVYSGIPGVVSPLYMSLSRPVGEPWRLRIATYAGSVAGQPATSNFSLNLPNPPRKRWIDFHSRIRMNPAGGGLLQVWMDGTLIIDQQNLAFGYSGSAAMEVKFGQYRNDVDQTYVIWSTTPLVSKQPLRHLLDVPRAISIRPDTQIDPGYQMPVVANGVTHTGDGAEGQTYTAPAGWTDRQWYRQDESTGNVVVLPGATGATRVAVAADDGYRLAVIGRDPADGNRWKKAVASVAVAALVVVPRVEGLVTATGDGSVGQTYTGPAWTSPQWFRETLSSPRTRTAIPGATARTYVAQAADVGHRLVMRGTDAADQKLAPAHHVVMDVPILLDGFDVDTGYSTTGLTLTLDAVNEVQGASALIATAQGIGNRLMRTIGPLSAFGIASAAELGTIAWFKDELNPYVMSGTGSSVRLQQTTGTPGAGNTLSGGADYLNPHAGGMWYRAVPASDPDVADDDPTLSWRYSFDRTAPSGIPHAGISRYDALVARAQGRPTVVLTFDDGFASQATVALPILTSRGLEATWYLPTAVLGNNGRLSLAQAQQIAAAGMDMQMDGTNNDAGMATKHATPAAAVAELLAMRSFMAANGLNANARHFCYPNGDVDILSVDNRALPRAYNDVVTANGTTVVTVTSTTGVAVGMAVGGYLVPSGTRVASVDGATQLTLTQPVPAGTPRITIWDDSHPFFIDRLQDALRADGTFKTGRSTLPDRALTRFGLGARDLLLPSYSVSGGTRNPAPTAAELVTEFIGRVDLAKTEGTTAIFYIHDLSPSATFIHTPTQTFTEICDYLQQQVAAGNLDVLTMEALYRRDGDARYPLAG